MKINSDLSQRALSYTEEIAWVDSPSPGVRRRMLERDGDEVARVTSIVRYAPGSYFTPHIHGGGEEFLVLDGIFSDDRGDYGSGCYVRNPVGSKHTPHSKAGCDIFVKLWQMDTDDRNYVAIDTNTAVWQPGLVKGLQVMPLHTYQTEEVALVKWEAGTRFNRHTHSGGEEIFVLEGVFEDEFGRYPKGTWLRNPPNSIHAPFSTEGCLIYVKVGHLGSRKDSDRVKQLSMNHE
jgi:anti-sigma factor ChrR (cupin superfamily)